MKPVERPCLPEALQREAEEAERRKDQALDRLLQTVAPQEERPMMLSPNFSLDELTRSDKARELGIDNTPGPESLANLKRLCETILEPARVILGKPIIINSGYRCPALNTAVKGAPHSQHMIGQAADFVVEGMPAREVCMALKDSGLPYHQLIFENYANPWTHISWSGAPRRQAIELPSGAAL